MENNSLIEDKFYQVTEILKNIMMKNILKSLLLQKIFLQKMSRDIIRASNKVVNYIGIFVKKLRSYKGYLLRKIEGNIIISSVKIQKHIKSFLTRKNFREFIKNRPRNYLYIIKEVIKKKIKIAHLRIKFKEDFILLKFEYCKTYNMYYAFVNKKFVDSDTSLKVNFYIDGVMLNNLKYKSEYDENGNFLNVIDLQPKQQLYNSDDSEHEEKVIKSIRKKSLSSKMLEHVNKDNGNTLSKHTSEEKLFYKPILRLSSSKTSLHKRVSFSNMLIKVQTY